MAGRRLADATGRQGEAYGLPRQRSTYQRWSSSHPELDFTLSGRLGTVPCRSSCARNLPPPVRADRFQSSAGQFGEVQRVGAGTPSIVVHSYGTYIAGEAMLKYPEIKFDRMILCGAILRSDFPWDDVA